MANFSAEQLIELQAVEQRYRRDAAVLWWPIVTTLLQTVCLAVIVFVEYGLIFECVSFLKEALPGEKQTFSVHTISLAGTIMLVGYHLRSKQYPSAFPANFIGRSAAIAFPVFALGIGSLLAASLYFDGVDGLFSGGTSHELFGESALPDSSFAEQIFSKLGLIFVFGIGGLSLVTLYSSQFLISAIDNNIKKIMYRFFVAKEARSAMAIIRDNQIKFEKLLKEREALVSVTESAIKIEVANQILAARIAAIAPYETWLANEQLQSANSGVRFTTPDFNFDVKEMSKRVSAERALTVKQVLAAFKTDIK